MKQFLLYFTLLLPLSLLALVPGPSQERFQLELKTERIDGLTHQHFELASAQRLLLLSPGPFQQAKKTPPGIGVRLAIRFTRAAYWDLSVLSREDDPTRNEEAMTEYLGQLREQFGDAWQPESVEVAEIVQSPRPLDEPFVSLEYQYAVADGTLFKAKEYFVPTADGKVLWSRFSAPENEFARHHGASFFRHFRNLQEKG